MATIIQFITSHWPDVIEILFFSSLCYGLTTWLKKDTSKNLLPYFYGTCAITLIAYTAGFSTILSFLLIFLPSLISVFILLHQETLQRNIIALRSITPTKEQHGTNDWQHTLIKTALIRLNNNKEIRCMISCNDEIISYISSPFLLHTPITQPTLELLLESPSFDTTQMIWFDAHGFVRGMNTSWLMPYQTTGARSIHDIWSENCELYTKKLDTFCFRLDPETRLFTVIKHGIMLQGINAQELQKLLRVHLTKNNPLPTQSKHRTTLSREQ